MKLQLVKLKCAKFSEIFIAPEIVSGSYGEFLLRSVVDSEEACLNAIKDESYQEVNSLLKANARVIGKKPNKLAEILHKTYGAIACDPDSAGHPFQIGRFPKCPSCDSQEMEYWEATEPPEFVEKAVRSVTHAKWGLLSRAQKEAKVDEVLSSMGN